LLRGYNLLNQSLSLGGIKEDSPAGSLFLRCKSVGKGLVDLLIRVASLKAYLLVRKVSVKEESLDTEFLIACKLWLS
jgi:hypothetical protein